MVSRSRRAKWRQCSLRRGRRGDGSGRERGGVHYNQYVDLIAKQGPVRRLGTPTADELTLLLRRHQLDLPDGLRARHRRIERQRAGTFNPAVSDLNETIFGTPRALTAIEDEPPLVQRRAGKDFRPIRQGQYAVGVGGTSTGAAVGASAGSIWRTAGGSPVASVAGGVCGIGPVEHPASKVAPRGTTSSDRQAGPCIAARL
jgi:hypothetical protein